MTWKRILYILILITASYKLNDDLHMSGISSVLFDFFLIMLCSVGLYLEEKPA